MRRWLTFSGRASRREYWVRTLLSMAVFFFGGVLLLVLAGIGVPWLAAELKLPPMAMDMVSLGLLLLLVLDMVWYLWVVLAVSVRRLHDLGFSGPEGFRSSSASWRACFARGTAGPNAFGPDPLAGQSIETR